MEYTDFAIRQADGTRAMSNEEILAFQIKNAPLMMQASGKSYAGLQNAWIPHTGKQEEQDQETPKPTLWQRVRNLLPW